VIIGEIKLIPQYWGPPGIVPLTYVAPDESRWNVERIIGRYVQLWTVNPWGAIHTDCVTEKEFREEWNELKPSQESSPESPPNDSASDTSKPSENMSTSSSSKDESSPRTLLSMLSSILT
jgi:hypothetical protein